MGLIVGVGFGGSSGSAVGAGVGDTVGVTVFFGVSIGPEAAFPRVFGSAIVAKTIPEIIKMVATKICIFFDMYMP